MHDKVLFRFDLIKLNFVINVLRLTVLGQAAIVVMVVLLVIFGFEGSYLPEMCLSKAQAP